jgi:hypothetical protein
LDRYQTWKFEENGDVRKNAAKSDEQLIMAFIKFVFQISRNS